MKLRQLLPGLLFSCYTVLAVPLPVIVTPPANQIIQPGNTASFSVVATGATDYQWRFNGVDLAGATGATLQVANAQTNAAGYYLVIAKNSAGWVPSQMAYLTVASAPCQVPFNNFNNTNPPVLVPMPPGCGALSYYTLTNGMARLMAGPQLDQMMPWGAPTPVFDGYYDGGNIQISNAAAGAAVYYRVDYGTTNSPCHFVTLSFLNSSTTIKYSRLPPPSLPAPVNIRFPHYIEWQEPVLIGAGATNVVCTVGQSITLSNHYEGWWDYGTPSFRWRKDGKYITDRVDFTPFGQAPTDWGDAYAKYTLNPVQASDAGIYDVEVLGNQWFIGQKITMSVLGAGGTDTTNGPLRMELPRIEGSNFVGGVSGATGTLYTVQVSTDLVAWSDLFTISNMPSEFSFTNQVPSTGNRFYRVLLAP